MQKGTNNSYFGNIKEGIKTSIKGLKVSMRHFKNARKKVELKNINDGTYFDQNSGIVTLQYPNEALSIPDIGRYRLYNEMDDCIVCDKCAKVCPVDCIDIEPIKSAELIGNASDGSPIRLYAAKFDIDMAKCCFCGLCTTVCPTECLTMTKAYDFAEFDVKDFNYHYANLSPEQAEDKKRNYEQFVLEKEAAKAEKSNIIEKNELNALPSSKPLFRPGIKKQEQNTEAKSAELESAENEQTIKAKPVFRPNFIKPEAVEKLPETKIEPIESQIPEKTKPVFRPVFKKPDIKVEDKTKINSENKTKELEKPALRPVFKKPEAKVEGNSEINTPIAQDENKPKNRPVFRPVVRKPKED